MQGIPASVTMAQFSPDSIRARISFAPFAQIMLIIADHGLFDLEIAEQFLGDPGILCLPMKSTSCSVWIARGENRQISNRRSDHI